MLILAVDSATPVAGIALVDGSQVLKEEFLNYKKTHSETLLPAIDRVLKECECSLEDLSAIAVTIGPGSFTGLRIGLAAVKGLSVAAGKPIIGVSTLDVLAHNVFNSNALVCALLNARKNEIYHCMYDASHCFPVRITDIMVSSPQQFLTLAETAAQLHYKDTFIMVGDGFYQYGSFLKAALGQRLIDIPLHSMLPRAAALGSLAINRLLKNDLEDTGKIKPLYIRLSEAENRLGRGEV
ncbi:MAG: tRNA (adenosine(37)-N6)-threonylcarbamoyltransferase complex dimerization subunit type 1 TsaB [Syntrophomonadaceae bacterium]|jgi:tRNA threonylcarbamoyladenosine biosynthesis protein TsaB